MTTTIPEAAPAAGVPTIIQLIATVMAEVTHVGKDGWNDQQKFKFRGIDAVINAFGPAARRAGIVPAPKVKETVYRDVLVGAKRTPMQQCTVKVRYRFWGPAGDHLDVKVPGEAMDSGDKGTAKAMSVAYRTALIQLLALPTDEPDPDATSYERAQPAETDHKWLAAVRQRIDAAADTAALDAIGAEIGAQSDAGNLAVADGTALRALFDARWSQLQAEGRQAPADDEWTRPEPQQQAPTMRQPQQQGAKLSKPMQSKLHAMLMAKRGLGKDRAAVHTALGKMVGRHIESASDITFDEAERIYAILETEPNFVNESPPPAATGAHAVVQDLEMFIDNSDGPQQLHEAGLAIAEEFAKGNVLEADRTALQQRWTARSKQLSQLVAS